MGELLETRDEVREAAERGGALSGRLWVEWVLLAVAAVFFGLHFVHLRADFPNGSPWMDWAKYTDEGWYGDAAIRHYQLGRWNVPGDFNPGVALPVWPAMEWVLFRFTGVSLAAARAMTVVVFGGVLAAVWWLVRTWVGRVEAAVAVVLLAVSPFCFVFFRLAILEPLMILLMLVALVLATEAGRAAASERPAWWMWSVGLGVVLPAMVLTKTTAVALMPAVVWMVWSAAGFGVRRAVRALGVAGMVGVGLWGAWYGLVVRPRYLADFRYLFDANAYTGFENERLGDLLQRTVMDGTWMGKTIFWVGVAGMAGVVVRMVVRGWKASPLGVAMGLWVMGYGAFLFYHANLQPRYYLVLAVPLTVLAVVGLGEVVRWGMALEGGWERRAVAAGVVGVIGFAAVHGAWMTLGYVRRPEYTWVSAAARVREAVDREMAAGRGRSRLMLGISGSDLSLMTGLPSICDDFGSMLLAERVATYKPGWFAAWNAVEDDKMEALAGRYRLVRVMEAAAFDDPERNLLILYRLDALDGAGSEEGRRVKTLKGMRSKSGEQPGLKQLKH